MKILTIPVITALLIVASVCLPSCSNLTPAQQAQASAIANLAISYAQSKGKISAEDANLVREVGSVVLAPAPTTIEVSGK